MGPPGRDIYSRYAPESALTMLCLCKSRSLVASSYIANSNVVTEIQKVLKTFRYPKGCLTLAKEHRQDLSSVTLRIVTIVADMTIHPATLAETDIRTLDPLRLLITAIILHPVVVHLATSTMIGETTADLHRLRVMMVVLLTLNMIIHLATHTCHAPDTALLQGTCMNGALLTVTPIRPLAIVLGHPVLQGDVMNSGGF